MRIRTAGELGLAARQRRRDLKLSQETVAGLAGVTRQWLVRFEGGNTEVTLSKAFAVLGALDLVTRVDPTETSFVTIPKLAIPRIDPAQLGILDATLTDMRGRIADIAARRPPHD